MTKDRFKKAIAKFQPELVAEQKRLMAIPMAELEAELIFFAEKASHKNADSGWIFGKVAREYAIFTRKGGTDELWTAIIGARHAVRMASWRKAGA